MKKFLTVVLVFALVLSFSGVVLADPGDPGLIVVPQFDPGDPGI